MSTAAASPRKKRKTSKATRSEPSRFFQKADLDLLAPEDKYQDLQVCPQELRPSAVLTTGQCFHWKVVREGGEDDEGESASAWGTHDASEWVGTLRINGTSLVVAMKETESTTLFQVLHGPADWDYIGILRRYFQLDIGLADLYKKWSREDEKRLARIAECIPGVRLIDQDPWECLISFICSTNNNIPRITKMVTALRQRYGSPLVSIGEETLYSFPSFQELKSQATGPDLRELGMGYRAKYIIQTMDILESLGGEEYLQKLRDFDDADEVQEKLIQFAGVGRKVADCVALFSLKQADSVPVDVHVWDIARRDYDTDNELAKVKSLTPKVYQQVVNLFRSRFQEKAGWAHSLLFVAELPSFLPILPDDLVDDMRDFDKQQTTGNNNNNNNNRPKASA